MVENVMNKLTLDRPVTYQIKIAGQLDTSWAEWHEGLVMAVACEGDGPPVTSLTVTLDQAALQGLLRRLYAFGLPLISINWVEGV